MALKCKDAVLEYGDTADYATSTTWTTVAKVESIKPPKRKFDEIDTTTLEDDDKQKEPGLGENDDAEITCHYDKTQTGTLYGFSGTVKAWRVKYSDASGWKFNGFINDCGDEEIVNNDIARTTLKVAVNKMEHAATLS